MENLKEYELDIHNDNEQMHSMLGHGEGEYFLNDLNTMKAKESITKELDLMKKGVYLVYVYIKKALGTPGRNITANISLRSKDDTVLFRDDRTLYPTVAKMKQEYNTWILFVQVAEQHLRSHLSINYKSNAHLNSLEISTVIKHFYGNNKEENEKIIEDYIVKNSKLAEYLPFQVVLRSTSNPSMIINPKSLHQNQKEGKKENIYPMGTTGNREVYIKEIKENHENFLDDTSKEDINFFDDEEQAGKEEKVVGEKDPIKILPVIEHTIDKTDLDNTTPSSNFVLLEKKDPLEAENLIFEKMKTSGNEDEYFEKKIVLEDYNHSVSNFSKYTRTVSINPGVYALKLDINNKILSHRRTLQITYKIFSHAKRLETETSGDSLKPNLIEKFSQKQIQLLKNDYIFLKPDISVPNEGCTFWLKIKSPVMIPIKVDVKLIQTKSIKTSEESILMAPLKQITEVKNFITELIPVKKNVWSIQKTLSFSGSEIFEIELNPGFYTFFITKLDNLDIPLRNFKCNVSLYSDRFCEGKQSASLKTICVDQQIGDGENSLSESTFEYECDTACILRIKLDAATMSAPIPFYARVQKITKFDIKTLKHEGLNWAYYLCLFLGVFVFLKYSLLLINFLSSPSVLGIKLEILFVAMFFHWFYTTGQFSNLKSFHLKFYELRLKSGFEKFKMFLKHARSGEEERQLEILNRRFSDDK